MRSGYNVRLPVPEERPHSRTRADPTADLPRPQRARPAWPLLALSSCGCAADPRCGQADGQPDPGSSCCCIPPMQTAAWGGCYDRRYHLTDRRRDPRCPPSSHPRAAGADVRAAGERVDSGREYWEPGAGGGSEGRTAYTPSARAGRPRVLTGDSRPRPAH